MNEEYFNKHVGDLKSFHNTSFDNIFGILNSDILETSINLIFFF